jgi:hypothetical protein
VTHRGDRERKAYDTKTVAEYPHGHRASWPAKKARRHREERRHARQILLGAGDRDVRETIVVAPVHREALRAWPTVPMRQWIAGRLEQRVARTGWNLFLRQPYCGCSEHAARYAAVIRAVTAGSDRALAEHFARLLAGDGVRWPRTPALDTVLRAQPALNAALRAWIARLTAQPSRT